MFCINTCSPHNLVRYVLALSNLSFQMSKLKLGVLNNITSVAQLQEPRLEPRQASSKVHTVLQMLGKIPGLGVKKCVSGFVSQLCHE